MHRARRSVVREGGIDAGRQANSICTTAPRRRCAASRSTPSPARSPACSAATASARPACCAPSSAQHADQRAARSASDGQATSRALPTVRAGAPRHRLCAAGPRDLPAADGARKTWRPASRRCRAASATMPDECSRSVPGAEDMLRRRGGDLSGGQQQQLAIGRALVMRPRLLSSTSRPRASSPRSSRTSAAPSRYLRGQGRDGHPAGRAVSRLSRASWPTISP